MAFHPYFVHFARSNLWIVQTIRGLVRKAQVRTLPWTIRELSCSELCAKHIWCITCAMLLVSLWDTGVYLCHIHISWITYYTLVCTHLFHVYYVCLFLPTQGGFWVPKDGSVNPSDLAQAFVKGAVQQGDLTRAIIFSIKSMIQGTRQSYAHCNKYHCYHC